MDPIEVAVKALVAGGVQVTKGFATEAAKEAYLKFKRLLQKKLSSTPDAETVLRRHETKPNTWDAPLRDMLAESGVGKDPEILDAARELLEMVDPCQLAIGDHNIQVTGRVGTIIQGEGQQVTINQGDPDTVVVDEISALTIAYDNDNGSCNRPVYEGWQGTEGWVEGPVLYERLYRIGVSGAKDRVTEGVIVRLDSTDPDIGDLPRTLHPMRSQPTGHGWEGNGVFDIRPDDTEYVDVLRFRPNNGLGQPVVSFVCQDGDRPSRAEPYEIIVTAQALKGQKAISHFKFDTNNGETSFTTLTP